MNDVPRWWVDPSDRFSADGTKHDMVLASAYDALAAENAALKADAERYRWLVKRNPTYFNDIDRQMANEAHAVQPDALRVPTCQLAHDFDERGFCRFCGINQHLLGVPLNAGPPSNSSGQRT